MTTQFTKFTRMMTILLTALALAANGAIIHGRPAMASTTNSYLPQENGEIDAAPSDFNGDGWADLAIGAPYEDVNGNADAGAINVTYGTPYGLGKKCPKSIGKKPGRKPTKPIESKCITNLPDNQYFDQETPGILESSQANDHFGGALAYGDFNADGYSDLAVGIPKEDIWFDLSRQGGDGLKHREVGAVVVIYGSPDGLKPSGGEGTPASQVWWLGKLMTDLYFVSEFGHFGASLAAGDFDGDGDDDLAVGMPGLHLYVKYAGEDLIQTKHYAGDVRVIEGSPEEGLTDDSFTVIQPSWPKIPVQAGAGFGSSLAAGDFNGDKIMDLAVGSPDYDVDFADRAGAVTVIHGDTEGDTFKEAEFWPQGLYYSPVKANNQFGYSLAAGDFNGDGKDDLAVGMPYHDVGGTASGELDAGAVIIMPGTSSKLNASLITLLERGEDSVIHFASFLEQFGKVLAAGDLNGDGFDDLAVGVQCDDSGGTDAGSIHIFYGFEGGVNDPAASTSQNQIITQETTGIGEDKEAFDLFGASLVILNFGKGAQADLAIGVPGEDRHNKQNIGMVHVLYGSQGHISGQGSQMLDQETFTSADTADPGDFFGVAVK